MATGYSQTQNNNNQIEVSKVITDEDTTGIQQLNNDSIDILRSSDQCKSLRECFITNCNTFKEKSLDVGTTTTNISKNIHKTLYALLIYCKRAPLELLEQVDYWVLNVSVYNVAYNFKR